MALLYASRARVRVPAATAALAAAVAIVALVSAAWSVAPQSSVARAAGFATVLVAAGALAVGGAARPEGSARLLAAAFTGIGIAAALGLLVLAVSPDTAIVAAEPQNPARYRGFGENPNTVPVLAALGLPIGAWLFARVVRGWARVAVGATCVLLLGTIAAADSRASYLASFAGLAVVLAVVPSRRTRLVAAGALVAAFAVAVTLGRLPDPEPAEDRRGTPVRDPVLLAAGDDLACVILPRDEEDAPPCTAFRRIGEVESVGSGRPQAWRGALEIAGERPLLGYGFGTEAKAFVDHYYPFAGDVPENSYLGMLLQLGVAGTALFLALLAAPLLAGARALRVRRDRDLRLAALGVVVAGGILAVFQSYLYAPGNVGTLTFWLGAFTLAATSARARAPDGGATIIAGRDG